MADITIRRPHGVPLDDAKARLKRLVEDFQRDKPDLVQELKWQPDGLGAEAGGKHFTGRFKVDGSSLFVEVDLKTFTARLAKSIVEDRLGKAVSREFPA